jgi:hypothetical protein
MPSFWNTVLNTKHGFYEVVLEEREHITIAYHEIRKHGSETRW